MDKLKDLGIVFPEILIPDKKINKKKWPVIACDQFTSNIEYWTKTAKHVGNSPSSLHIIVPEIYLNQDDVHERVEHVKTTMTKYIEEGVLVRLPKGIVLVERETPFGTRMGVIVAVDLEKYSTDYTDKPLIRATEETVSERIPPRMRIRENAALETSHVMLLINDPDDTILAELYNGRGNYPKIYDTPLMQGGGHIKGWFIEDEETLEYFAQSLYKLKAKSSDGMLFAVGDGNHSLASAKQVWDNYKFELSEFERENHPLRYALVELVNLYDHGISMYPIHRVVFNVETPNFLRLLIEILNEMGLNAKMMYTRGSSVRFDEGQNIHFEAKNAKGRIEIGKPKHKLASIDLTKAIDALLERMPKASIDYIHGESEFENLIKQHGCLGFRMEALTKDELFDLVQEYGVLPRKSFSLGEAQEKRYYYECRLLLSTNSSEEEPIEQQMQQEAAVQEEIQQDAAVQEEPAVTDEPAEIEEVIEKKQKRFGKRRK